MGEKKEHKTYLLLDAKIAKDFHEQAMKKAEYPLDYGGMRVLKQELIDLCGVTELEAHNILCGRTTGDTWYISAHGTATSLLAGY